MMSKENRTKQERKKLELYFILFYFILEVYRTALSHWLSFFSTIFF